MTTNAITLTSPHELLAVVPYLLGFHPTNSIMVLCLRDRRLGLAQRLDLPRSENADDVASTLLPSLITENPESVIAVGYEDHADDSLPAMEALTTALQSHSMPIHDRLVVRNGRWRSLNCHNLSCCPAEGSPLPEPADVSGVVAEFVGQGVSPHPDRESLARQVEPGPQAAAVASLIWSRQEAGEGPASCRAVRRLAEDPRSGWAGHNWWGCGTGCIVVAGHRDPGRAGGLVVPGHPASERARQRGLEPVRRPR